MTTVFGRDLRNTCPDCGAWLSHEGGCTICKQCGLSLCGRWSDTIVAFCVTLACVALMVFV
jgi:hypothetical protein